MKFAMIGAGFWAPFQLAAWHEITGVRCVAVCDRDLQKAEQLAARFSIPKHYDDIEKLLADHQDLNFVDIVTNVDTHEPLANLAIDHGIAAICQKPLAPSLEIALQLCAKADTNDVPLLVHENWRWQTPIRRLKEVVNSGLLGTLVRARIDYAHSFPVFDNQPFLKTLKQFILMDIGTHILDTARYLFGESDQLFCQTQQTRDDIAGEDVATVMLRFLNGLTVTCNMSYGSRWELDRFPQTMIAIEGTQGGVSLGLDFEISTFDERGRLSERVAIAQYPWADPTYALVHASIVDCQRNLLGGLRGEVIAETTGNDNLKTLVLVHAAYQSAETCNSVMLRAPHLCGEYKAANHAFASTLRSPKA